jgi:hypothetical protein
MLPYPARSYRYLRTCYGARANSRRAEGGANRAEKGPPPKLRRQERAEILAMLAAGRAGAEMVRIFRVHPATIRRIAAEARAIPAKAELVS